MENLDQETAAIISVAEPFVGQWRKLVSRTNWEKGRIIHEWRSALIAAGAPQTEYSDEAWSRLVGGNITGQHAGRLRRVYDRFGQTYDQYEGLYWSHFQSAVDWDDAEMWLEGAVQNGWSVAAMRRERWQTKGAIASEKPQEEEVIAAESDIDEDCDPSDDSRPGNDFEPTINGTTEVADGVVVPEGPDFGDEEDHRSRYVDQDSPDQLSAEEAIRPFENLAEMPDDIADAFEGFKLAILRHKATDWQQVSADDVLACLDALKQLVTAPASAGQAV